MKKIKIVLFLVFLVAISPFPNLFSQELTHEMTDDERARMPFYLEQVKERASTPPTKARSIAEFEKMKGVLITYPLGIPVSMVKEMASDDIVYTIVDNSSQESSAKSYYKNKGVNINNCVFVQAGHDSHWTRDYGPWFIAEENKISIVNFTYNRPRPNDNKIPKVMANFLNLQVYNMDLVQCGGNYMTDGLGIAVSTDLVYEENSLSNSKIKQTMSNYLGIDTYHVTDDPLGDYIKHVDCWGKFLAVDKILITRVPTSSSKYKDYEDIVNYFKGQESAYGTPYKIYRVYSPKGEPYTNSLILNKKVYVPLDNSSADNNAIKSYKEAMPGYEVIGFQGDWFTTDAAHCRTKGLADNKMVYIEHVPLSGEISSSTGYKLSADIMPYSGTSLKESAVGIYYRVNGGSFQFEQMAASGGNTYSGTITAQTKGSSVEYYIHAEDKSGNKNDYPLIGAGDPFLFTSTSSPDNDPDDNDPEEGPIAYFSSDTQNVTAGSTVQFSDDSLNNPTSWKWTFTEGTPATSTEQNPVVTYNTKGTYTVSLTVKNQAGSDTKTITKYITVKEEDIGCGIFKFLQK